jgi:subtilisin
VLSQLPRGSAANVKMFSTIPFVALEVSDVGLDVLSRLPEVSSIEEDALAQPTLMDSTPLIGATAAWSSGYSGQNAVVAILDTGVDKSHSFLSGKVVSEACYSTTSAVAGTTSVCPGGSDSTAPGSGVNCSTSLTGCSHGTHVAGIAAGRGSSFSGVAPNASVVAIQVFSRQGSSTVAFSSDVILGLERVYSLRSAGNIAAANLSLGGNAYTSQSSCDAAYSAYKAAIDNLRSAGVATVVASGRRLGAR